MLKQAKKYQNENTFTTIQHVKILKQALKTTPKYIPNYSTSYYTKTDIMPICFIYIYIIYKYFNNCLRLVIHVIKN